MTFEAWPVAAWANDFTATDVRLQGGIVLLVLNRPDAANARNQQMRAELKATYEAVAASDDVLALIMRGAGEKFFCAGMDLKEASASTETIDEKRARLKAARDIEMLANLPQPTIAAINGYALGGGLEMAMACDFRIAAHNAQMGLTEVDHGLVPGGGGTIRLPALVGKAKATEMILLGQRVDGDAAAALGLVTRAVDQAELDSAVLAFADAIAAKPTAAVRAAKVLIRDGNTRPLAEALDNELDTLLDLMEQHTSKE